MRKKGLTTVIVFFRVRTVEARFLGFPPHVSPLMGEDVTMRLGLGPESS